MNILKHIFRTNFSKYFLNYLSLRPLRECRAPWKMKEGVGSSMTSVMATMI